MHQPSQRHTEAIIKIVQPFRSTKMETKSVFQETVHALTRNCFEEQIIEWI